MARRRRAGAGVLLAALVLAGIAVVAHRPLLTSIASILVAEDRLEGADAIVVVAGGTPAREAAAANLYREQWAPRVVISRPFTTSNMRELQTLGVRALDQQGEARLALEKYGVPPDRIVAVAEPAKTTEPELDLVHKLARADGYRRVILVTSAQHTRRVKLIWARASRKSGIASIVVPVPDSDFDVERWWRSRRAAETVLHEYLGLTAIYLGVSQFLR